jgi:type II restriction/modification system DNA methylase subunit YeeA
MQQLETENNRLFIKAYGLQDELAPEVPEEQITLARADASDDTRRLLSYAIGCMMGRYSLDEPGLIYANSGGAGFDPSRHGTFAADADGIIPVTDLEWFDDDGANRFCRFVRRVWGDDTYGQNVAWIAAQLSARSGEMPVETIRRYFSAQFFKDHLQTYKKRPIYWLFSSGKQKAFECLVYLHRYNESTLSRMRNEYVTPLFGKLSARIEYLGGENGEGGVIGSATSTSEKNKLRKQLEVLKKKQIELAAFDDQLRHYADMRIQLDLDDGVKVNYGKFGNLLAEVRAVTGGSAE